MLSEDDRNDYCSSCLPAGNRQCCVDTVENVSLKVAINGLSDHFVEFVCYAGILSIFIVLGLCLCRCCNYSLPITCQSNSLENQAIFFEMPFHCSSLDTQVLRVIFTGSPCVFSPLLQRQLADHMPKVLWPPIRVVFTGRTSAVTVAATGFVRRRGEDSVRVHQLGVPCWSERSGWI
jgi:hypothetical protein